MGRKAEIGHFATKNGYFTTHNGKRHRLSTGPKDEPIGPTYQAALVRFKQLMGGGESGGSTIDACLNRYTAHLEKLNKTASLKTVRDYLTRGRKVWGVMYVQSVKMHHMTEWLDSEKGWGSTTKDIAYNKLLSCLNWNKGEGFIESHGLVKKKKPEACVSRARGEEFAHPVEFLQLLISEASGRFKDYLTFLHATGCRPSEGFSAEPYHYRPASGCIVYKGDAKKDFVHKNATKIKRGDRDRIIFLTPELVRIVERNIEANPTGRVMPSRQSGGYTYDMVRCAFGKLRSKLGVVAYMGERGIEAEHVILYSFRHSYATRALAKGVPIATLAHLMGTSVRVIQANYGHLSRETEAMRAAAMAIAGV